jgi:hypothetical protein
VSFDEYESSKRQDLDTETTSHSPLTIRKMSQSDDKIEANSTKAYKANLSIFLGVSYNF